MQELNVVSYSYLGTKGMNSADFPWNNKVFLCYY
jgi:hypothetical protein